MVRLKDRWLIERALMIIAYIYGWDVVNKLRGLDIEVEYNEVLRRIKHIYVNGNLAFSVRASDGLLIPTIYGARFLNSRVVVKDDVVPFVKQGKSVPVKGVLSIENAVQNMDIAIVGGGEVLGIGRLMIMPEEARTVGRGFLVKVRHHVK